MTERDRGTGSVSPHRGAWRARLPGAYGRRSLGVYATEEEARAVLDAALVALRASPPLEETLGQWGASWLTAREDAGHHKRRTLGRDRTRWAGLVEGSLLARVPLLDVSELDVRRWLASLRRQDGGPLAPTTLRNALGLVRGALEGAREAGRIPSNPAAQVRLSAPARRRAEVHDAWTWLTLPEIDRVLACDKIPLRARAAYATAIYAGLRAGELWGLRWQDVDLERGVLRVRRSFEDTPKAHAGREVQILAPLAEWLRAWRRAYVAARVDTDLDLVWPARDRRYHADGYDAGWATRHRAAARIRPGVRLHDLRHTCASHLLQGSWSPALLARPLRLEEVRDWLGHTDVGVTQRYAHLCAEGVRSLVVRPPVRPGSGHDRDTEGEPLSRFELLTYGLRNRGRDAQDASASAIEAGVSRRVSRLRELAQRAARAIANGDPHRDHRALDLVEAVLEATTSECNLGKGAADARGGRKRGGSRGADGRGGADR